MNLLTVDQEKCKQCGTCIAVCPFVSLIEINDTKVFPAMVEGGENMCVRCGHCVSVCPQGALSHEYAPLDRFTPIREKLTIGTEQMEQFLRSRRSIRFYEERSVEPKLLTKVIDIARFAPSGHNSQPVNWLVIQDREEVQRIAEKTIDAMRQFIKEKSSVLGSIPMDLIVGGWDSGTDIICRRAPHLIVVHGPESSCSASESFTIALSYFELAALSYGLGTCWAGLLQSTIGVYPPLAKALELPEGHISMGAMIVGYPKSKFERLPARNDAKVIWR